METTLTAGRSSLVRLQEVRRWIGGAKLPWISVVIVAVLLICAVFAPVLTSYDPTSINMLETRVAPGEMWSHPLGTDLLGRDMLSRLIYGARTSVMISLAALGSGMVVGTMVGLISGYNGGKTDAVAMRVADAALGFPSILVAMVIVVLLGSGIMNIILAVVLTVWARFARMIRGEVLSVKEMDYVTLARLAGVSTPVIMWRHIFPNTVNVLMVMTSLLVGQVILLEASLSFLGLGLAPGHPAWGIMVAEGRSVTVEVWWLALLPGLGITAVVVAFNFFGDWIRDALDPKLRRL